ncbi:hypothetical protein [Pontibacter pamirensis]|uniref:hypothetical protein n=1 Tax=Pontibacter pamirensis TaxID=2562824 RepID=UPI001389C04A|nr:hypothetical protein [Pontibacter pamirensis]
MESSCQIEPNDKKGYIKELGNILVREYGKKRFYKPEEVKKAHRQSKWSYMDFSCWGMSVFSSHEDFDAHHQEAGESCDYVGMKSEMLGGLSMAESGSWIDIPDLDIDASWLDFGEAIGGVLGGIGELLAGVGDALS